MLESRLKIKDGLFYLYQTNFDIFRLYAIFFLNINIKEKHDCQFFPLPLLSVFNSYSLELITSSFLKFHSSMSEVNSKHIFAESNSSNRLRNFILGFRPQYCWKSSGLFAIFRKFPHNYCFFFKDWLIKYLSTAIRFPRSLGLKPIQL